MTPAARLRQRLAHPGLILAPACATPMSALVAQQEGFEAVALGGYTLGAHTAITEPLFTMAELVEATRRLTAVLDIPVVVDGGAGFGEPLHTMRTVRELEQVGAAAVHIEDQIFPKRAHYHRDYSEHVIPAEAMAEKIAYAVRARRDPDFLVIARTDAIQTDGYAEGVRRARLYAEAGADMVMLFPKTVEEARQAPRDCGAPLVYVNSAGNRTGRPLYTTAELETLGYRMCVDAISLTLATYLAVKECLSKIKQTGMSGIDPHTARDARLGVERAIGLEEHYRIEENTVEAKGAQR
jgi:methylisocitrate lyase